MQQVFTIRLDCASPLVSGRNCWVQYQQCFTNTITLAIPMLDCRKVVTECQAMSAWGYLIWGTLLERERIASNAIRIDQDERMITWLS
jgi:hypothetical protein